MALAVLHTHDIVYGDQCKMNAVLRKGRGLLLIDFYLLVWEGGRAMFDTPDGTSMLRNFASITHDVSWGGEVRF